MDDVTKWGGRVFGDRGLARGSRSPRSSLGVGSGVGFGIVTALVVLALWLGLSVSAMAQTYQPFVLAERNAGSDPAAVAETLATRLTEGGFQVLGSVTVSSDAVVVVATHDELLRIAAATPRGGYIAPIRVSATRVDGAVQVGYTDPEYFRIAYGGASSAVAVRDRLAEVLGREATFGATDMDESRLARYRYAFGMERFTDPMELGTFPSHAQAVSEVTTRLAAKTAGVSEVYRLQIPGTEQMVIGVAIREEDGAPRDAADRHNLETVDVGATRHTAYLPYEVLINGRNVEALHMRYRMALHFPDLRMMGGEASFMALRRSPDALLQTLTAAVGG